jgi:hypothetical protein
MGLDPATAHWREFVRAEARRNGYLFVDIVDELRSYPPQGVKDLFYGHFSVEGNRYVADLLYRKLKRSICDPTQTSVTGEGLVHTSWVMLQNRSTHPRRCA